MAVMWGAHLIKQGSALQSTIALSSGVSEYYAFLRSSAHPLGIKAMLSEWRYGVVCEIRMCCDRSGQVCSRRTGEIYVDVRFVWLQHAVKERRLKVLTVPTSEKLSDTFTKSLSQGDADR